MNAPGTVIYWLAGPFSVLHLPTHRQAQAHPPVRLKLLVTRERLPGLCHPQFALRGVGGAVQLRSVRRAAIDFGHRRIKLGMEPLPIRAFYPQPLHHRGIEDFRGLRRLPATFPGSRGDQDRFLDAGKLREVAQLLQVDLGNDGSHWHDQHAVARLDAVGDLVAHLQFFQGEGTGNRTIS